MGQLRAERCGVQPDEAPERRSPSWWGDLGRGRCGGPESQSLEASDGIGELFGEGSCSRSLHAGAGRVWGRLQEATQLSNALQQLIMEQECCAGQPRNDQSQGCGTEA